MVVLVGWWFVVVFSKLVVCGGFWWGGLCWFCEVVIFWKIVGALWGTIS